MSDKKDNFSSLDGNKAKNKTEGTGGIMDRGIPVPFSHCDSDADKKRKERISTERIKRMKEEQKVKMAERKALQSVTIHGKTFDLRKEPPYRRNYLIRLSELQTSPLKAIRLKCLECSAYSPHEAGNCNAPDCALWVLLENRKNKKDLVNEVEA